MLSIPVLVTVIVSMRSGSSEPFWAVANIHLIRRPVLRRLFSERIEGISDDSTCRQKQTDRCSCFGSSTNATQFYCTVNLTNNHATRPKSQARASCAFRAEERLKELFRVLAANTMSVISNTDSDSAYSGTPPVVPTARPNPNRGSAGFHRIRQQTRQQLLHPAT